MGNYTNATAALADFTGNNTNSLVGMAQQVNSVILGGWLGIVIWMMIIITMFGSMKARGITTSGAFASSAFTGFIICVLLTAINLVPSWFLYINIVAVAIIGVVLVLNKNT